MFTQDNTLNELRNRMGCGFYMLIFLLLIVLIGTMVLIITNPSKGDPHISLTVNALTGLPQNKSSVTFSPFFNFTLSVKVHKHFSIFPNEFCYERGHLIVLYKGVQLATGPLASFCTHENERREDVLFAWGKQVEMPDPLRDLLFEEERNGEAIVEVDLTILDYYGSTQEMIVCTGKTRTMEVLPCNIE